MYVCICILTRLEAKAQRWIWRCVEHWIAAAAAASGRDIAHGICTIAAANHWSLLQRTLRCLTPLCHARTANADNAARGCRSRLLGPHADHRAQLLLDKLRVGIATSYAAAVASCKNGRNAKD